MINFFLWLIVIVAVIITPFFARWAVRHRLCMLWIGVILVICGCIVYSIEGENPLVSFCNSVYSFFPSRGDFRPLPINEQEYGKKCNCISQKQISRINECKSEVIGDRTQTIKPALNNEPKKEEIAEDIQAIKPTQNNEPKSEEIAGDIQAIKPVLINEPKHEVIMETKTPDNISSQTVKNLDIPKEKGNVSSWYWVFHLVLLVYILSIILALLGISLVNLLFVSIRLISSYPVNVFWDYCNEARALANSMNECTNTNNGKASVVFALRRENVPWFLLKIDASIHKLMLEGWKWVYASPGQSKMLMIADRHFFLGANGHENVSGAEALVKAINNCKKNIKKHIKVFVRIHSFAHDDIIYKWADLWNQKSKQNVEIILLREEAIVSHGFLLKYPMLNCPKIHINEETAKIDEGDFRILLIGFGALGRCLLNDMICDGQYIDSKENQVKISVDVIDKSKISYGEYTVNCEDAVKMYNIKFQCKDTRGADFWEWLHESLKKDGWNRIVICQHDDCENISIAMDIIRYCKWLNKETDNIVFARVRNPHISAYAKKANESLQKRTFTIFGNMNETYRFDALVRDKWDLGAMMVNKSYQKNDDTPEKNWKITKTFDRESSRASFFHQRNLLKLLGYTVDETALSSNIFNNNDFKVYGDTFARLEHMRWMAWHLVQGIKPLSPEETLKYGKANQIETRNAHGDLRNFDELPDKEKLKNKEIVTSEAWVYSGIGVTKEIK